MQLSNLLDPREHLALVGVSLLLFSLARFLSLPDQQRYYMILGSRYQRSILMLSQLSQETVPIPTRNPCRHLFSVPIYTRPREFVIRSTPHLR